MRWCSPRLNCGSRTVGSTRCSPPASSARAAFGSNRASTHGRSAATGSVAVNASTTVLQHRCGVIWHPDAVNRVCHLPKHAASFLRKHLGRRPDRAAREPAPFPPCGHRSTRCDRRHRQGCRCLTRVSAHRPHRLGIAPARRTAGWCAAVGAGGVAAAQWARAQEPRGCRPPARW